MLGLFSLRKNTNRMGLCRNHLDDAWADLKIDRLSLARQVVGMHLQLHGGAAENCVVASCRLAARVTLEEAIE